MGKIFDLLMSGSWKEYREIRTLREAEKLMKSLSEKNLSPEKIKKIKEIIDEK